MSERILVKRLSCRVCGGPKVTPLRTAFVYCDYCGAFTDWDFQIANNTAGSERPDPQYEALYNYLKPRLSEGLLRGDRQGYAAAQRQLFDVHVRTCRAAYSPRIGDPAYRRDIIEYWVWTKVVADFDPQLHRLGQEVDRAEQTMRWVEEGYRQRARPDRFWNLFGAWNTRIGATFGAYDRAGVIRMHPDGAPAELLMRIEASAFVQKWLPLLGPEDGTRLLAITRLAAEYAEQPAVATVERHCGACGADLPVAAGARRVVCFSCGFLVDVGAAEIPCHHCGSPLSAPAGARQLSCPRCRATTELVRAG